MYYRVGVSRSRNALNTLYTSKPQMILARHPIRHRPWTTPTPRQPRIRPPKRVTSSASASATSLASIDDQLSRRDLALDPLGYFIIKLDPSSDPPMIQADFYSNTMHVLAGAARPPSRSRPPSPSPSSRSRPRSPPDPSRNDQGLACDDDGEVIGCGKGNKKVLLPRRTFRGRTAKEVSVEILESQGVGVQCDYCSHLEHANYLGRELQKAEFCLRQDQDYVQD